MRADNVAHRARGGARKKMFARADQAPGGRHSSVRGRGAHRTSDRAPPLTEPTSELTMFDTAFSSILSPAKPAAAVLGGLLFLIACQPKENATDGDDSPSMECAPEGASSAEAACCEGLAPDFSNTCVPCVPEGQARSVDDGGCCEGLVAHPTTMICEEPLGQTESTGDDPTTSTSTSDDTGTDTAGACAGHDIVDACCCFALTPGDGGPTPPTIEVGCGDSPLCSSFEIFCGDPEDGMSSEPCTTTSDEAALDCALAALAAGKPGSLHFELRHSSQFGFWGDTLSYYIRDDGTAFVAAREFVDSSSSADVSHRPLQPTGSFADCQATDSVEAKIACLRAATTDEVIEQCATAPD
ncbi:hypothetical protein [Nannocystis pusilla]|uniref:Uncharacterized protein n=1 Tax=Nannocystis pusilla TaxID=889268 RepID=A0ABS7TTY1_9BACT|nr:hypothetical protein [Nannocystis pusilla]MBZ5711698.1 hypothetical protein [Nannocystis pusilla]